MTGSAGPGPNPLDTAGSAASRFLVELIAWVAGPWAAGTLLGGWAILPAAVILVGVPAVFSTRGDKHQVIVSTPGPVRFMIEVDLSMIALVSAWYAWPRAAAVAATAVVGIAQIAGWRRSRWLLQGAPPLGSDV